MWEQHLIKAQENISRAIVMILLLYSLFDAKSIGYLHPNIYVSAIFLSNL